MATRKKSGEEMQQPRILVLGIGNLLWADEGFGVRTVEELARAYEFPANVTVMDGGTQGLALIPVIRDADVLVIFDAVDYGMAPGALLNVEGAEVPKFLGAKKLSLHQTGFQEVLVLAELMGELPESIILIGVQPAQLEDYGGSLSPEVKAQIAPAIATALEFLGDLGVKAVHREVPLADEVALSCPETAIGRYESERPGAEAAYRAGDARVVFGGGWCGPAHDNEGGV